MKAEEGLFQRETEGPWEQMGHQRKNSGTMAVAAPVNIWLKSMFPVDLILELTGGSMKY